ncbi:MAG: hypothetical protein M1817_004399 [Caeruleum heppii]|nr:MAG: hypothetical protein M1817_004399 [Caeruleum heppii]
MGNVSSRPDEGAALYLRDQSRLSLSSLTVTNPRGRGLLDISPNAFPATRLTAKRDANDDTILDYVQDPESPSNAGAPSFLIRLNNDEELEFQFTFVIRQQSSSNTTTPTDTIISGLTWAFASSAKELDNLVTREFHADPNLHKNSNVQLVGDFATGGSSSAQFGWTWKWRPPKVLEDRGGGWRNSCSFLEYDQRAHRLNTLASFSFWVQNTQRLINSPHSPTTGFDMTSPPKIRVASSQSVDSRLSNYDMRGESFLEPPSPNEFSGEQGLGIVQTSSNNPIKVDVSCQRPGEDMSAVEDGPLFRATMKALEQKTGNMRTKMKKVLKKAEAAQQAQVECNTAAAAFMDALREASLSNAHAIQPALEHYFERIAREILLYEKQNTTNLQKLIIEPLNKLYNIDIKQAESKKKDFEEESRDYYAYVGRYLGQRQDSLKEKKRAESDSKYQTKRRNFELKRFDYSSFMQDLHGGRKEQEVLSHLTRFAEAQTKSYLKAAKKVEEMVPQLEALTYEVKEVDKEFQFQRTEREEKRRTLEKSTKTYVEPESNPAPLAAVVTPANGNGGGYISDSDLSRAEITGSNGLTATSHAGTMATSPNASSLMTPSVTSMSAGSPGAQSLANMPSRGTGSNKFKGIRDLEEKDYSSMTGSDQSAGQQRKEGLLWALSRPGSHADPKGLNKQAWHKFWIVLDQGKLSEYSNWKQRLDLHMEPIDLRLASVREARNAERRFCFEVITPQYKRVYQATSEEDMNNWIFAINNALQSAVEGRGTPRNFSPTTNEPSGRQDIRSALTGKSSSSAGYGSHFHHHHHLSHNTSATASNMYRRTTVGARPTYVRTNSNSFDDNPSKLLQIVRDADQGNCWCADCGSGIKTEWVSINLGIVLCIECSGIHRSLGTHISKVRSLTLDTLSFSTDIVELLLLIGNRVSNMVWEARLDPSSNLKPHPAANREQRLRFITAKYVDREYVTPLSPTLSRYSTADETLLASIKKNDLQSVLYALALGASPNSTDRSRATPAIFFALAAADPASPPSATAPSSTTTSSSGTTTPTSASTASTAKPMTFPVAELLVQNGAEIPAQMPPFPLGRSAVMYIEQKSGRGGGGAAIGSGAASSSSMAGAGASASGSKPALGIGHASSEKDREKEARLQKRLSPANRLSRTPILER